MNPSEPTAAMTPDFGRAGGLIPAVVQDAETREVLMLAYMNEAAWQQTLATGLATFFSRSRNRLWTKGETSGHVQRVKAIRIDCDADAILLEVEQVGGAACHTGHSTCFYREPTAEGFRIVAERVFDPDQVYKPSPSENKQ